MLGQGSKATFVALHQSGIICHCERTRRTGLSRQVALAQIYTNTEVHTNIHTCTNKPSPQHPNYLDLV